MDEAGAAKIQGLLDLLHQIFGKSDRIKNGDVYDFIQLAFIKKRDVYDFIQIAFSLPYL